MYDVICEKTTGIKTMHGCNRKFGNCPLNRGTRFRGFKAFEPVACALSLQCSDIKFRADLQILKYFRYNCNDHIFISGYAFKRWQLPLSLVIGCDSDFS